MEIKIKNDVATDAIYINAKITGQYLSKNTRYLFPAHRMTAEQQLGIIKDAILFAFGLKECPEKENENE